VQIHQELDIQQLFISRSEETLIVWCVHADGTRVCRSTVIGMRQVQWSVDSGLMLMVPEIWKCGDPENTAQMIVLRKRYGTDASFLRQHLVHPVTIQIRGSCGGDCAQIWSISNALNQFEFNAVGCLFGIRGHTHWTGRKGSFTPHQSGARQKP
jgi:hypothetical protein